VLEYSTRNVRLGKNKSKYFDITISEGGTFLFYGSRTEDVEVDVYAHEYKGIYNIWVDVLCESNRLSYFLA
jgi:hypothetical protein